MDAILSVELDAKINKFVDGMKKASTTTQETESKITRSTKAIGGAIAANLSGIFTATAIVSFGKAVIEATAQFQKFEAVLGNTLGSSALASLKLKEIQEFAAKTPFGVNELTGAFVKLANSGFKPTGAEMTKLGDLASSTGKSFDQLAEAILDAQTGEFERLKEFGVRAKDAGDKVIFTFKGVQTTVEKSSAAIRDYITGLGSAEGVSGAMAKISETLGGKISNLGDSWDQMLLSVGGNTSGVFVGAIDIIGDAINSITEYNKELELASKYKISSFSEDLGQRFVNALQIGGPKTLTNLEAAGLAVRSTEKSVNAYVSSSILAAKKTSDFGDALATLKKKADAQLANVESSKIANAIKEVYQTGIKAVQDARTKFLNPKGGNANFGKGLKDEADKIKEIYQNLANDLKKSPLQVGATKGSIAEDNITAYQKAINGLVDNGIAPASKAITELIAKQSEFLAKGNILDPLVESGIKLGNLPIFNGGVKGGIAPFVSELQKSLQTLRGEFNYTDEEIAGFITNYGLSTTELLDKTVKFNEQISSVLNSGLVNTFQGLGDAIGNAFANGTSAIDAIGISLLSSFGSMLVELGQIAIATGVGIKAISTALKSLNPVVAIAGGVALVALGSAIKGKVSNIGKNANSSSGSQSQPITAFANGGIISGPTLGLMGEYAGAKSDPEVVAPLSKLKGLLGLEDTKQSSAMNAISTIMGNTSSRADNVTNMNIIKNMMGQTDSSGNVIQRTDREVVVLQSETVLRGSDILIITKKAQSVASRIK